MSFIHAWQSLLESKARSALSALGIMVASVAILLLVSIGLGVQKDVGQQVEDLGVNLLICLPGRVDLGTFNPNLGGQSWFKDEDGDALRKVKGVRQVASLSFAGGGIRHKGKDVYPLIIATTPEWFEIHGVNLREGQIFDANTSERVVVLGGVAATEIFGKVSAIGQSVEINGKSFKIIGVTEDKKSEQSLFNMQSFQNVAYYPYRTHKTLGDNPQIDRFMVQTDPETEPKTLVKDLEETLGKRLDRQQYSVLTQEDLLGLIYTLMSILSTLVFGLTSIALFVGGVGILAVMMMAVNERRREIGVRMALGATRKHIFQQILWESVLIGLAGVLAGLVLSSAVAWGLSTFTKIKPLMNLETILLAFAVGIGVGAFAGLIPAMRAARQDPVVSLRQE